MACTSLLLSIFGISLLHTSRGFLASANETVITETNAGSGSCPVHCKIKPCVAQVGCSLCENGFCLHYQRNGTSTLGICLASCPSGFYCEQFRFSICRACKDTNCDTCDSRGKCTKCKIGFSLMASDSTCHAASTTPPLTTATTTADSTTTDIMSTMGQAISASTPNVPGAASL
ncbi:R-spondin-1-like isoform X1 [Mizuhopecten yessoensis]|uniref:R-spondin-1-like isoform X1 n=1 Tax=Mizuhopecten yessoensis TaxID=6573 RepID=UPI000B45A111|nr:R-spondin-1-like isoform X1 [Mizuhopecten yessoensis]